MYLSRETLENVVELYGTPTYVYNGDLISKRYRDLLGSLDLPRKRVLYAMKANCNPHILDLLRKEGASIDAVSPAEVHLALSIGFPAERIMFTGNMQSDADMEEVHSTGVLLNIDCLSRLEKFGKAFPGSPVCIRINPDVVAGAHEFIKTGGKDTKFGINISDISEVLKIVSKYNLSVVGIHEHTGSGISEQGEMQEGMENILREVNMERFPSLRFLNFGGGIKVPYDHKSPDFDLALFGQNTSRRLKSFMTEFGRELEVQLEPGKYIVAQAGSFLVTVTTLKQNQEKRIAGVDSGFNHFIRPMFYSAWHQIDNLSNPTGKDVVYDIVGNICETGDHFAKAREIAEINEGDILSIYDVGAYGFSMASEYNMRPTPAEVLIQAGKISTIHTRSTAKELAKRRLEESGFVKTV